MTTLSTHVLDAALGEPASGLDIVLTAGDGTFIAASTTDGDGRVDWARDVDPGIHTLTFATGEWFDAAGRATFFPTVTIDVALDGAHAHVALLLSPFSYTTYKGS